MASCRGYSPLSRVLELEGLIAGVNGKLALWHSLLELAPVEPRLDTEQLGNLARRAEAADRGARRHHPAAAGDAFARVSGGQPKP